MQSVCTVYIYTYARHLLCIKGTCIFTKDTHMLCIVCAVHTADCTVPDSASFAAASVLYVSVLFFSFFSFFFLHSLCTKWKWNEKRIYIGYNSVVLCYIRSRLYCICMKYKYSAKQNGTLGWLARGNICKLIAKIHRFHIDYYDYIKSLTIYRVKAERIFRTESRCWTYVQRFFTCNVLWVNDFTQRFSKDVVRFYLHHYNIINW